VIDYDLTDEQRASVDMAHDFALNEIRPIAAEWDVKGEFPLTSHSAAIGRISFNAKS